jgi:pimeloyl-ACP methyl ester carboxylesterase
MFDERTFEISSERHLLRARSITSAGGGAEISPALVFLHEGLGSIEQWRDFPRELVRATGLAAVVYDRPGFGGSQPLQRAVDGPALQRADISDLTAVVDACGIGSPILIGHSDGGTIALLYAARFPERPRAVIAEASHVFVEQATLTGIREAGRLYRSGDLRQKLSRYHGEKTDAVFGCWSDDWLLPQHGKWNIEATLPAITCPLLVIQGEDDEYGTLAQVEALCSGVSGRVESVLIPGCGHSPHLQAKQRVVEEMARFIAGL